MNKFKAFIIIAASLLAAKSFAAVNTANVNVNVYASTNVTTGAYVTLFASTPITTSKLEILDTSGKILKLAVGAAGSEIDLCTVPVSGTVIVPTYIVAGTRISIKAIDASATTGYSVVSLVP